MTEQTLEEQLNSVGMELERISILIRNAHDEEQRNQYLLLRKNLLARQGRIYKAMRRKTA